jgi:hypothetical protein
VLAHRPAGHGLTQGIADAAHRRDPARPGAASPQPVRREARTSGSRRCARSSGRPSGWRPTAADADARLTLLTPGWTRPPARAVELALGAGTDADVAGLGSEVDEVVDQLEALRLALGEVAG